jgi:O-antigen/teichoic acid export membrane protein
MTGSATRTPDAAVGAKIGTSLRGNAAWMWLARVAQIGLGLALILAISRILGPTALGQWRYAQAAISYALVFSDVGLSYLAIREISRDPPGAGLFGTPVVLIQVVAAIVLYGFLGLAVVTLPVPEDVKALIMVLGLTTFTQALSFGHVLQGFQDMAVLGRIRISSQLLATAIAIVVLLFARNLLWVAVPTILGGLIADWLIVRVARSRHGLQWRSVSRPEARGLLTAGSPFLIAAIGTQLIISADALIIGTFLGEHLLGLYSAPYVIANQLLLLGGPLMLAAYPRLASHGPGHQGQDLLRRIVAILGFLILPVALGGMVTSDLLIKTLYGPAYASSASLLPILLVLPAIGYYNMALNQTLGAMQHQWAATMTILVSAAVNVSANIVLIPTHGLLGAAIAVVLTEVVTAIAQTSLIHHYLEVQVATAFLRCAPAALGMAITVLAARIIVTHNIVLLILIGILTYGLESLILPSPISLVSRRESWRP